MKRTSVVVDPDVVRAAAAVLGTTSASQTVRAALEETIRREQRRHLAEWELRDLTPGTLQRLRDERDYLPPNGG